VKSVLNAEPTTIVMDLPLLEMDFAMSLVLVFQDATKTLIVLPTFALMKPVLLLQLVQLIQIVLLPIHSVNKVFVLNAELTMIVLERMVFAMPCLLVLQDVTKMEIVPLHPTFSA